MRPHLKQLGIVVPLTAFLITFVFLGSAFAASHQQLRAFMGKHYDPKISSFVAQEGSSAWGCRLERVFIEGRDPVSKGKRTVYIKQYRPNAGTPDSGRAIIVMPPTGGENPLDNKWGNELCKRGFRVALVQSWYLFSDEEVDLRMYDRVALRSLVAILHTTSYLKQSGASAIGILGTSLGAIQASAAVGYDPRITAAVLVVGGIRTGEILAVSNEVQIAKMRKIRMDMWKLTPEQYLEKIKAAIKLEPADFIGMTGPKKVFSVIATNDITVPTRNQELLYEAYGKQEVIRIPEDHLGAVKATALGKTGQITEFFDKNL